MTIIKNCKLCGNQYIAESNSAKYCGTECKRAAQKTARAEYNKKMQAQKAASKRDQDKEERHAQISWTFHDIILEQERYRNETGRYLSYGKTVQRLGL